MTSSKVVTLSGVWSGDIFLSLPQMGIQRQCNLELFLISNLFFYCFPKLMGFVMVKYGGLLHLISALASFVQGAYNILWGQCRRQIFEQVQFPTLVEASIHEI